MITQIIAYRSALQEATKHGPCPAGCACSCLRLTRIDAGRDPALRPAAIEAVRGLIDRVIVSWDADAHTHVR